MSELARLRQLYNIVNPFSWMEMISIEGKTNFFEKRVANILKTRLKWTKQPTKQSCWMQSSKLEI